jgi:hypothetical protein
MSIIKTPFELGQSAYKEGLSAPIHDRQLMTLINDPRKVEAGGSISIVRQWNSGWKHAKNGQPNKNK